MIAIERLNTLINYFKVSNDFLTEIKKTATHDASEEDLKKLMQTSEFFTDTLIALNDLKTIIDSQKTITED